MAQAVVQTAEEIGESTEIFAEGEQLNVAVVVEGESKCVPAAGTKRKKQARKKVAAEKDDYEENIELFKRDELTAQDVICPICWSILYKPTTLPCKHSLCLACYLQHVEETSLYCPCCRRRLSIWSRKAKKHNELLDVRLWDRLKSEFAELIQARENGDDSQGLLTENKTGFVMELLRPRGAFMKN